MISLIKKAALLLLLLCLSRGLAAQQHYYNSDTVSRTSTFNYRYIVFSPFALMAIEPAMQLGYEYPVKNNLRLQHELGYISLFNPLYQLMYTSSNGTSMSSGGFRLRTTAKFILKADSRHERHPDKYLGIDVMFKYLSYTMHDYPVRRMNAYWELVDIQNIKYVTALHFLFGMKEYISSANKIIADWYVGVGLRYKYFTSNMPSELSSPRIWYDNGLDEMLIISVMGGMKLDFGLNNHIRD